MEEHLEYLELVRLASRKVLLPEETVRLVLEALLETMKEGLVEQKRIILREFGTLRATLRNNPKVGDHVTVIFRGSPALQKALKELLP